MCGIIGYNCPEPKEHHMAMIEALILQSKIRGLHSFGLTYLDGYNYTTKKYSQNDFTNIIVPLTKQLIFHNRYSTSGDYNNPLNNQPLVFDDFSMVFNGVISMDTKEHNELLYGIDLETDNDGEILIKRCGFDIPLMLDFISSVKCSYSGLILNNRTLTAMRNKYRPGWILETEGAVFVASTKDIFDRALGENNAYEMDTNRLYRWIV